MRKVQKCKYIVKILVLFYMVELNYMIKVKIINILYKEVIQLVSINYLEYNVLLI